MLCKIIFTAALLGAAVALPGGKYPPKYPTGYPKGYPAPYSKKLNVVADFDDLTAVTVINDLFPIGEYKYLDYQGFSVGTEFVPLSGQQLFGVVPKTPQNVAYSDAITSLFAGPALVADGKTKSFDLKSFYYACIDVTVTPVATPENCAITVTGFRGTEQVATQPFTYDEDVLPYSVDLDAPMTLAKLNSDFTGLTSVTFTYETTESDDPPASFLLDHVKYTVYLSK